MATTAQQVFIQAMSLADEMTDTINVVNASDTASYLARTPGILTLLQAELIRSGDLYKTFEFSRKPLPPLGGVGSGFDYVQYTGDELIIDSEGSVRVYTIDIDGEATVYVEDTVDGSTWNTLATISATDPTTRNYTTYSGVVTPTSGATRSRFRFGGTYEYTFTNYAMFKESIKTARIPAYAPWVKVTLPSDFKSLDQVVSEYPEGQYGRDKFYKWENATDLYVDYSFEGTFRINYRPIPAVVSTMSQNLDLDDVTCRTLLPYGLTAELFKEENEMIAKFARARYVELKQASMLRKPSTSQDIVDVYGGF